MSVQQGLDPQQITAIAERLTAQSEQLQQITQSGSMMLSVLGESWAGHDLEAFSTSWQHVGPQLDTAKKIADRTEDGIREGVDRVNDGIDKGLDRAREGMDWLEDRADQVRDWGQEKAERLVAGALAVAVAPALTGLAVTGTVNRELLEAFGAINEHGEAGKVTQLSSDARVNGHPPVRQPTSLYEIMRGTGDAYENDGTVRITEITRPDGTSAYIVNIPGTQFGSDVPYNPLDGAGNVPTVNGKSSAATEAVWDAMQKAGIPPGAPVLTVGHSQGGLISQTLLADPAFTQRFNVTHSVTYGSPVDAIPDTSDVHQLHLRHESDLVPRLDLGNGPRGSLLQDGSTVVPLDDPPGVQPLAPSTPTNPLPALDALDAHAESNYAKSVKDSHDARITTFEDDLGNFIVQPGDTSHVSAVDIEIRRKD